MASNDKTDKLTRLYEMEGRNTSSTDPKMMEARVFIGNLASDLVTRQDVEKLFGKYGKILGVSLHKSFGFVQFDTKESAMNAVQGEKGNLLQGLKMDLCIATERRRNPESSGSKGGRRPPRIRSRSPRRRRDREWERGRWDWYDRRPSPPPLPHRLRGRDPFFDREDPYFYRDDPFDRFPPPDLYDRYPPPRGYPRDYPPLPPHRRRDDRYEMELYSGGGEHPLDRERMMPHGPRSEPFDPILQKPSRTAEMEIIVVSQQQKEYAQRVRQQVESIGILVEMRHLSPTFSLLEALDSAAKRGFLYTIIITSQHEAHHSVTLTILHGRNPQEHKNMPLADAIGLIERDYDHYCHSPAGRASGRPPSARGLLPSTPGGSGVTNTAGTGGDNITALLAKAAAGGNLSSTELNALISTLQEKQNTLQPETRMPSVSATTAEDIQQQQADLQAKILSLLGSNAVVPTATANKPTGINNAPNTAARRFGGGLDNLSGFGSSSSGGYANTYPGISQSQYGGYR